MNRKCIKCDFYRRGVEERILEQLIDHVKKHGSGPSKKTDRLYGQCIRRLKMTPNELMKTERYRRKLEEVEESEHP